MSYDKKYNKNDIFGEVVTIDNVIVNTKVIEQLKKKGIEILDLPIGDYSDINDISELENVLRLLEMTEAQDSALDEDIIEGWDIDVTELDYSEYEYYEQLDNLEELREELFKKLDSIKDLEDRIKDLENINTTAHPVDTTEMSTNDLNLGNYNKKDFKVTIPSHEAYLTDNKFNYTLISMLAKESIKDKSTGSRMVFKEEFGISLINNITNKYGISDSTIRRGISKLVLDGILIDKKNYYILDIKVDNRFFIEIHSTILDKIYTYKEDNISTLTTAKKKRITVDTMLRLLTYLSYKLKGGSRNDLSIKYMCKAIGLVNKDTGEPTKEHTDKLSANLQALKNIDAITIFTALDVSEVTGFKGYLKNNTYALGKAVLK
ncbi:hypothetical protein [Clostridioides difficile]|uniref:hypothetical protein n=1 Tax=Clostridioides difficile TaxID=1496 RepID=UPI001C158A08|nr:hypothetical protein [Clostridioides difficile]HBF6291364.1 hypothetical protein [Clostridioides difficile]HBG4071406.1 hypothetical protein [Clostridioides difficile]HBY2690092.1 hypothetical protein [Clostridioides difficile]HDO9121444.1 hypothetical protein [Clostridioides difficile]